MRRLSRVGVFVAVCAIGCAAVVVNAHQTSDELREVARYAIQEERHYYEHDEWVLASNPDHHAKCDPSYVRSMLLLISREKLNSILESDFYSRGWKVMPTEKSGGAFYQNFVWVYKGKKFSDHSPAIRIEFKSPTMPKEELQLIGVAEFRKLTNREVRWLRLKNLGRNFYEPPRVVRCG